MYFNKTESLRTNKALFITLQKLHKNSEKVTLADWINSVIVMSGQSRTGGSSMSAASSRAVGEGFAFKLSWPQEMGLERVDFFYRFYYKLGSLSKCLILNKIIIMIIIV